MVRVVGTCTKARRPQMEVSTIQSVCYIMRKSTWTCMKARENNATVLAHRAINSQKLTDEQKEDINSLIRSPDYITIHRTKGIPSYSHCYM